MKEDPKGTEGPTAPKWIPMTSNGDPSWVPVSSDRDPTASKWIPISNRDPAVTKEDPPSSNETPAAERDPKAPPEGRPVEQPDPTAAPDPKASKWIPAASNGDREATRRNPKPCSGDPTAEPDPEASNCAPASSNWAPSAVLRGPTSTNRDPPAQPNPGQHRGADWDPAAPMEEDQDPTTHRVHPAAEPSPEQHHGEEWDPSPPMGPSPPMDPSAPMEEDQDPTTHPVRPTAEPVPAPYRDPPGTEEAPPLPMAAVEAMLAAVAASPVRVCSQQQGDPELTAAERHGELRALFLRKPLIFLERFHGALRPEHLPCFAHLPPSYEVAFYCRRVRDPRRHNPETGASRWPRRPGARTRLRNRRYAALRQLIAGGEYFSEEEMRAREPLLYEHYIGQYQDARSPPRTPPGPPHTGTPPGTTWAAALLRSVEEAAVQQRLQSQRLREGDSGEEDEDEDEAEGPHVPDAGEREMLREEFRSRMYQRFLDGEDGDFDYSQVDENPDMDNLDIESRDAEERYFDDEEPSAAPQLE